MKKYAFGIFATSSVLTASSFLAETEMHSAVTVRNALLGIYSGQHLVYHALPKSEEPSIRKQVFDIVSLKLQEPDVIGDEVIYDSKILQVSYAFPSLRSSVRKIVKGILETGTPWCDSRTLLIAQDIPQLREMVFPVIKTIIGEQHCNYDLETLQLAFDIPALRAEVLNIVKKGLWEPYLLPEDLSFDPEILQFAFELPNLVMGNPALRTEAEAMRQQVEGIVVQELSDPRLISGQIRCDSKILQIASKIPALNDQVEKIVGEMLTNLKIDPKVLQVALSIPKFREQASAIIIKSVQDHDPEILQLALKLE